MNVFIPAGSICALIGPSGSGKSVFFKTVAGLIPPFSGKITLACKPCDIGFLFQEGALFDSLTALENVAFPLVQGDLPLYKLPKEKLIKVVETAYRYLKNVGLAAAYYKYPHQLSGGMRKRLALARALVQESDIKLLDDPSSGLDPVASSIIFSYIVKNHKKERKTTVISSHDLRRLLSVCNYVVVFLNGKVAYQGVPKDLIQSSDEVKRFISCRYDLERMSVSS
ncbi:MAG: ATP-binding cassette domain-containing protein [Candidatus Dadabacteria bacterium]|nr:MAG: ATP-binding cassette domain-containing protein [Candidatus Dadabacteria bacterium]